VFLHFHIAAAATALGAVWIHLHGIPQQRILYGVVALWAFEVFLLAHLFELYSDSLAANRPPSAHHHAKRG
jgi:hypothetical protein